MNSIEIGRVAAVGVLFAALSGCPSAPASTENDAGGDRADTGGAVDAGGGRDGSAPGDAGGGGDDAGGGAMDAGGGDVDAGGGGDDAGSATDAGCSASAACLSACDSARTTCEGCVTTCGATCDTTRTTCTSSCAATASSCRTGCGTLATCRTGCNSIPAGPSRDACLAACDACLPGCTSTETSCNSGCDGTHTSCVAACGPSCAGAGGASCAAAAASCTAACASVTCSGVDAAVGIDAAVAVDAAVHFSFASPAQIDLHSVFLHDTVAASVTGGSSFPPLTSMDASHYVLMTATFAGTFNGLPDDGRFAADANHPDAQLAWRDGSFAPNSVILNAPGGIREVTFPVVPTAYTHLQLYFVSTEGASQAQVVRTYADATSTMDAITVPDWFTNPSAPIFVVQGSLARWDGATRSSGAARLMGTDVAVDGGRTLASVTVRTTGPGRLVLYGATAY